MLSKLERKQKLPICYCLSKGLPHQSIQVPRRCEARVWAVGASVRACVAMRMHTPRRVPYEPNPKTWQMGTPGWAFCLGKAVCSAAKEQMGRQVNSYPTASGLYWLSSATMQYILLSHQMESANRTHPTFPQQLGEGTFPITGLKGAWLHQHDARTSRTASLSQHSHTIPSRHW